MFQVGFNAAAQLKDPTPLSLQSCSEGLRREQGKPLEDYAKLNKKLFYGWHFYRLIQCLQSVVEV